MDNNNLYFLVSSEYNVKSVAEELDSQLKQENHSLEIEINESNMFIILSSEEVFSKKLFEFVCLSLDGYAVLLPSIHDAEF